jgi:Rne/Rng family ribonuclease
MSDSDSSTTDSTGTTGTDTGEAPAKKASRKAAKKATKRTTKKATGTAAKKATGTATRKAATKKVAADEAADGTAGAPSDAPSARKATKKAAKGASKRATKKATGGATKRAIDDGSPTGAAADDAPQGRASGTDASPPDEGTGDGRTRTRTRSRARRPSGAPAGGEVDADREARDPEGGASASEGGAADGDGDRSDDGATGAAGPRRRRRGGRGRRGRGRGGESTGVEGRGDADDGDDGPDGAESSGRHGQGDRAAPPAKRAKKASSRGSGAKKSSRSGGGAEVDPEGDDTRIARGGTRLAAKKARRSGGQGGGQGGGGRRSARPGGVTEEERRTILAGPPRTMIVTAKPARTQIAVMEDRTLVEHYVTRDEDVTFVGNIYMGRVQNVLPGMEAAFIDIGKGRNGVLYAGEVLYDELDLEEESDQRIENVLKPGQKVLVQVTKDPMGTKGPRLTMHLSLAGRYVVLAPDSDLFGISRKLTDTERDRLRRIVKAVKPEGHGVIVRTAAEGATEEALTADVERLVERWRRVEEAAAKAKPLEGVYEEPKLVVKVIRDIFGPDFVRCIVDDDALHVQVRDYLSEVAPELVDRVELYGAPTDDERSQAAGAPSIADAEEAARAATESGAVVEEVTPAQRREGLPDLFTAFDVADQLRQAMNRKVWLPSGGYLIIESTEAMKVIDVNTGRFTGGNDSNLEEVVLKTNLEAADEIVRQLRLRDMGGMIIIDFIDMLLRSNQEQVVRRLKRELLRDRTKTRVSDVSRLGLVQMTRKNVSQGLVESFSSKCEKCDGHGFITDLT